MSAARTHLADAHRIVVKLGTHVVTHDGIELALGRVMGLVESMARLRQAGREVVLVSSGAVGMGMRVLGLKERPRSLGLRQACAAVGQGHLMSVYTQAFAQLGVTTAQVLLTQEDLADRDRALCLRTTLMRLLELGVVPVLNENDSVSVRELVEYRRTQTSAAPLVPAAGGSALVDAAAPVALAGFGDNDGLSARVAVSLDADLLVLLTNVGGLYTANPRLDPAAVRLSELAVIDDAALAHASGGSTGGTGGMASKLVAARLASSEGTAVLIAGGGEPRDHRARDERRGRRDAGRRVRAAAGAHPPHRRVGAASRRAGRQRGGAARARRQQGLAAADRRRLRSTAPSKRGTSSRSATAAGGCTGAAW